MILMEKTIKDFVSPNVFFIKFHVVWGRCRLYSLKIWGSKTLATSLSLGSIPVGFGN